MTNAEDCCRNNSDRDEGRCGVPKRRLKPGDRIQIISGLLAGRRGRYAGETSHQHIKVLLQLLGAERQVPASSDAVEQI